MEKNYYDSVLTGADERYLRGRGYVDDDFDQEELRSFAPGSLSWAGVFWKSKTPGIAFMTRSAGGLVAGVHTASTGEKEYRYFKNTSRPYLPIVYGSQDDYDILYRTRQMVLVEGVFDRIAIKRFSPGMAVFARLSKGVSEVLVRLITRYTDQLWLAFDMDTPGRSSVAKTIERMGVRLPVYDIKFPRKDPSLMLELNGLRQGSDLMERAIRLSI